MKSESMKSLDVCLSPQMIDAHSLPGSVVVVVDILRATSCIITAIAHEVASIKPVDSLMECRRLQEKGYIGAAERGGQMVDGFQLGNSPFSYMDPSLQGLNIAMTTTNGTEAITRSKGANQVLIGSFLNFNTIVNYLTRLPYDVLILCAGWKGLVNMEDTIYAGALVHALQKEFELEGDAPIVAKELYLKARNDVKGFLSHCSHYQRLMRLDLEKDIDFCLQTDRYKVIPVLKNRHLVKMSLQDMLF